MTYFLARANQAEEAVKRVRELHKKDNHGYCTYCYTYMGTASFYPCSTIKALDGEA